jgi:hypothetical protein
MQRRVPFISDEVTTRDLRANNAYRTAGYVESYARDRWFVALRLVLAGVRVVVPFLEKPLEDDVPKSCFSEHRSL